MNDQVQVEKPKLPDFMDWLVESVSERVKKKLAEELKDMMEDTIKSYIKANKIEADDVDDLNQAFDDLMEQYQRNSAIKVDADDVEGLEEFIKDTIKEATVNIDFV